LEEDCTSVRLTGADTFVDLTFFFTLLTAATVFDTVLLVDFVFRTAVWLFKVADLVAFFFGLIFDFFSIFAMIVT